jgi:hypothetical protein
MRGSGSSQSSVKLVEWHIHQKEVPAVVATLNWFFNSSRACPDSVRKPTVRKAFTAAAEAPIPGRGLLHWT